MALLTTPATKQPAGPRCQLQCFLLHCSLVLPGLCSAVCISCSYMFCSRLLQGSGSWLLALLMAWQRTCCFAEALARIAAAQQDLCLVKTSSGPQLLLLLPAQYFWAPVPSLRSMMANLHSATVRCLVSNRRPGGKIDEFVGVSSTLPVQFSCSCPVLEAQGKGATCAYKT